MGVSALSIAAMLAILDLFVDFSATSISSLRHEFRLTILLRTNDSEPASELVTEKEVAPSSRQAVASAAPVDRQQEVAPLSSREVPADPQPVKDWQAIAKTVARASIGDRFRSEESRATMWRQTRSMMFEPTGEFVLKEEAPVISGFRFKPRIHVVGLGLTIGSCFIGIPIAGVPIEQRTVALNLFVCASDSG